MWSLTVGQRHAIGQNSVVVLAQRKLEWGADSRGELGEICRNSTATSEGAYGAQFWLNAVVSFQMPKYVLL
jgi:hypothetical protein